MSEPRFDVLDAANDYNKINEVTTAANAPMSGIVDEIAGGVIAYASVSVAEDLVKRLNFSPTPDTIASLRMEIKDALEGDSNDAEHNALVSVADALGIDYDPDAAYEED